MTSVTYSMAYKRNLPNYENATAFFSVSMDVPEGELTKDEASKFVDRELNRAEFVKQAVESKVDSWVEAKIEEIDADVKR